MIHAGIPIPISTRPIESFKQQPFKQSYRPTASTNPSANNNISDKILSADSYPKPTHRTNCKATREPENTVKFYNRNISIATLAHLKLIHPSTLLRFLYLHRNSTFNFLNCSPYNPFMCKLLHSIHPDPNHVSQSTPSPWPQPHAGASSHSASMTLTTGKSHRNTQVTNPPTRSVLLATPSTTYYDSSPLQTMTHLPLHTAKLINHVLTTNNIADMSRHMPTSDFLARIQHPQVPAQTPSQEFIPGNAPLCKDPQQCIRLKSTLAGHAYPTPTQHLQPKPVDYADNTGKYTQTPPGHSFTLTETPHNAPHECYHDPRPTYLQPTSSPPEPHTDYPFVHPHKPQPHRTCRPQLTPMSTNIPHTSIHPSHSTHTHTNMNLNTNRYHDRNLRHIETNTHSNNNMGNTYTNIITHSNNDMYPTHIDISTHSNNDMSTKHKDITTRNINDMYTTHRCNHSQ